MDTEKAFGTAVRKWREKLHFSQEELAKRAGLHRTYICDVERGARNISLKNAKKVADALSIPIMTLLAELNPNLSVTPRTTDEFADILLVEDDANDILATKEAIKGAGITNKLFVVSDGLSALNFLFATGEFAHRHPGDQPRIILLDLTLPKIDGLTVLRRIKADPRTEALPVVILTGSKAPRDITECKRLGVQDYIVKPILSDNFSEVSLKLNLQWALLKSVDSN